MFQKQEDFGTQNYVEYTLSIEYVFLSLFIYTLKDKNNLSVNLLFVCNSKYLYIIISQSFIHMFL